MIPRGGATAAQTVTTLRRFCLAGSPTKNTTSCTSSSSLHNKSSIMLRHNHLRRQTTLQGQHVVRHLSSSSLIIKQSLFASDMSPLRKDMSMLPSSQSMSTQVSKIKAKSDPPQEINGTDSNSLDPNEGILVDRRIRVNLKQSHMQQSPSLRQGVDGNELKGYKYRLLRTPQLTNDLITLPEPPAEMVTPLSTQLDSSRSEEKESQLQHPEESSLHVRPNSVKDVISSNWWRNLYENIRNPTKSSSRNNGTKLNSQSFRQSLRSRRSSLLLEEIINNDSYTGFLPDERQQQEEEETLVAERVRVRSVQAASAIDVVAVLSKVFGGGHTQHPLADFFKTSPPLRHVFGRTNVIIQLSPPPVNGLPSLSPSVPRYVAIYRFGSVVFFNISTKEASRLLEQIKKHAVHPIPVGFERREHFEMAIQPQLETAAGKITADRALVRELDMNTVGVVSNIMGQTVALDWHLDTVDELLRNFSDINSSVERTGNFTSMERHTLFQVVARNNSLFIDMVGRLGIKDRSDTAWHLSQYEGLHEGMRKEFELDERFRHIEFKLNLIQQNAKFFLDISHAQKSNILEWVIIVLISFECVLMVLDMSGWGAKILSIVP